MTKGNLLCTRLCVGARSLMCDSSSREKRVNAKCVFHFHYFVDSERSCEQSRRLSLSVCVSSQRCRANSKNVASCERNGHEKLDIAKHSTEPRRLLRDQVFPRTEAECGKIESHNSTQRHLRRRTIKSKRGFITTSNVKFDHKSTLKVEISGGN